ncbi:erythromycin esterase family protein [Actinoplanes sp. NPDC051633]|uniref:erythromycin esterase family protein n=1 Tax=Actinoplanes sp. NPDC051633 TaxID=3155670 RepID=UPI003446EDDD
MTQDITAFLPASGDLLAFGEPVHGEPAFRHVRNDLFARLTGLGFRSIALEIDRVAALAVDDYVRHGIGDLDDVLRDGFSHEFGALGGNRELVVWMREYNEGRPLEQRLTFHGFDAATETMWAPSPRTYLEHARDYLGLDFPGGDDIAALAGDDERWHRTEAIMDPAESIGATGEADRLRVLADDMLTALYVSAPPLIAATSIEAWRRAEIHLTAGLGLLRYHRLAAQPLDRGERVARLLAVRDAIMARNLLDIRRLGPVFVFAHNTHLQRNPARWQLADMDLRWSGAGAILAALGEPFTFVAGSLGRSSALNLGEPDPDTYEGDLQTRIATWGLTKSATGRIRTDPTPEQGYFPLNDVTLEGADAILHINAA